MKGQSYIITALIFALIVAIFAVINVEPVEVDYLFGTGNAPLILVILFSVLMGGLITASVGFVRILRLQRENKRLKKENLAFIEQNGSNENAFATDVESSEVDDEKKLDE
ncbi:DUF1049 domain-containing protein [Radiobacillus kanasensis]|uniref:LapA family protein n=1 Tax=Radiobacillus kanasensis TaxID=2844358 RepID=UPI001E6132C4|nr:lipopolysaccharide assembly LapA domain-containing protein [Radiobacillus kanasensis]UFT97887.1 DUF1049 domain-containing protein [Radiobacillus kanasensis]